MKSLKIHRARANITRLIRKMKDESKSLTIKKRKALNYYVIELNMLRDELRSLYLSLKTQELKK